MNKCLFHLKSSFHSQDLNFYLDFLVNIEKIATFERLTSKFNFKIYDQQSC